MGYDWGEYTSSKIVVKCFFRFPVGQKLPTWSKEVGGCRPDTLCEEAGGEDGVEGWKRRLRAQGEGDAHGYPEGWLWAAIVHYRNQSGRYSRSRSHSQ